MQAQMYADHFTAIDSQNIGQVPHYHFLFDGPDGKLEGLLAAPKKDNTYNAFAVVCHPHPLFEGTLHNKVTYIIAKTIIDHGIPTLRFNFRGVEMSKGRFANGIGEKDDLLCAINKMKQIFPNKDLWLGGFSFGACMTLKVCENQNATQLFTVAPPVNADYFTDIIAPTCPWLLLQGLADEVVNAQEVLDWCRHLDSPPETRTFEDIGHYFHRRLPEIKKAMTSHIKANHP